MHLDNRINATQHLSSFLSDETANKKAIKQLNATFCKQILEAILIPSANADGLGQLNFLKDLYIG